jgi:glyoxylase-like metal-dependent hydrolase (beta-lactamase superfamily II)
MAAERVTEHVYRVNIGPANLFLIIQPESLTLIDAGIPGSAAAVADAVRELGRRPEEISDIVVTHPHPDHAGGLAELKALTGARVWMHPADAALVRAGHAFRSWKVAPGLRNRLFARLVIRRSPTSFEPVSVDREVSPGEELPLVGGLQALHTPGHTEGHLALLWHGDGGVLFLGDAANFRRGRLVPSTIYEDLATGLESLRFLSAQDFETACFAHALPIVGGASALFRAQIGRT